MKQTGLDMLYLAACALNGQKPDAERVARMELESVYRMTCFHSMTAVVCSALEMTGIILPVNWTSAKANAIRRIVLLDAERERICRFFEKNGIWYMPMKGAVLKEIYPEIGMRQMSDIDILYDVEYQQQIQKFMLKNNYKAKSVGKTHHDTYIKPPVYNFELHTLLFSESNKFHRYYFRVKKRLVKDSGSKFGYRFTDEDFYIYMVAHEYKHFSHGGTGVRSLMDTYVYNRAKKNLNRIYIDAELNKLGIAGFERKTAVLADKLFNGSEPELTAEEKELLDYYLFSGTYGTKQNWVVKKMKDVNARSKSDYLFKRLFPDMEFYKQYFPFFYRHKLLLPVCWVYRMLRGLIFRRDRISSELNSLKKL